MFARRPSKRPTRGHPRQRPSKFTVRNGRVRPVRPRRKFRLLAALTQTLRRILQALKGRDSR